MPGTTSNRPWMLLSLPCRQSEGLTVSGASPCRNSNWRESHATEPSSLRIWSSSIRARKPRLAFSKSLWSAIGRLAATLALAALVASVAMPCGGAAWIGTAIIRAISETAVFLILSLLQMPLYIRGLSPEIPVTRDGEKCLPIDHAPLNTGLRFSSIASIASRWSSSCCKTPWNKAA